MSHTRSMALINTPSEVRCAIPNDLSSLMDLLHEWHQETESSSFDETKVFLEVVRLMFRVGGVVGVVRGRRGVEASVGLALSSRWCSSDLRIEDLWCFVREPYRRSDHAKNLIDFSKKYASSANLPLSMEVAVTEQTEAKKRLYERRLGQAAGAVFLYNRQPLQISA